MRYLSARAWCRASQLDGSYDGTPARSSPRTARIANAGLRHLGAVHLQERARQWDSRYDTDLQLINDTGYPMYSEALSIRAGGQGEAAPCLKKLVPILQQATVDFITNPAATNDAGDQRGEDDQRLLDLLAGHGRLRGQDAARTSAWSATARTRRWATCRTTGSSG